jgi:hypothetical protein
MNPLSRLVMRVLIDGVRAGGAMTVADMQSVVLPELSIDAVYRYVALARRNLLIREVGHIHGPTYDSASGFHGGRRSIVYDVASRKTPVQTMTRMGMVCTCP